MKGPCLFFLSNFPEATFIQGAKNIPDSGVSMRKGGNFFRRPTLGKRLTVGDFYKRFFSSTIEQRLFFLDTMCCISLGRGCLGLETRVVIRISTYPCCPIKDDYLSLGLWLGWSKFFLKKDRFLNPPIFNMFWYEF